MELHHVHLSMLEGKGLIEYDGRDGTIRYYECELMTNVLAAVERYGTEYSNN
ncbi:hypothetical protein OB919_01440 [Halobacteria archaeon AArc-curdl1]|uniref:Uncharacterized protein n=1 Tax=Natronosalvus hydrolyticus TaxID=2979988 RepID=A0AAP3E5R1_9EURY|nr:hypothetical protein [Halobacteria archaeon AArc-curdl1]